MATVYIVGAGDFTPRDFAPERGDLVIAADGGYASLQAHGLRADLLVGDLDSLGEAPEGVPLLRFPPEKDDTDLALAAETGWQRGYRRFALYGAEGGRLDHTLANLQLMTKYSRLGADVRMVCPKQDIYAVTNGALILPQSAQGLVVSVLCAGERAEGVTLRGLRYPLTEAALTCERALGVSNERLTGEATIRVRRGTLLVLTAIDG